LDAVVGLAMDRYDAVLAQGTVLVDEADLSEEPRVLVYLDHTVTDARPGPAGRGHVVSRRFEFVSVGPDGLAAPGGVAPYLDYRPAKEDELALLKPLLGDAWLAGAGLEQAATDYAIEALVPSHLAEVQARTQERVDRTIAAVQARLSRERDYWDQRAAVMREQAAAGRQPKMNPERAQARADELEARRKRRLAELEAERQLHALPPVVVGGALVVPAGLLPRLGDGDAAAVGAYAAETKAVEERAMRAVLAWEARLGREPEAMPHNNPGFDIRSVDAEGHLLLIEVKGRVAGAEIVSVTRNEILTGLNAAERYMLALVEVRPDGTEEVRYLRDPFAGKSRRLHFAERATTFDWGMLWAAARGPA
jgi:hypothetical protein